MPHHLHRVVRSSTIDIRMTSPNQRVRSDLSLTRYHEPSRFNSNPTLTSPPNPQNNRMSKRTLDTFFKPVTPPPKKTKPTPTTTATITSQSTTSTSPSSQEPDTHPSYPLPIPTLPSHLTTALKTTTPAREPKEITNQPHLDLLYFQPYIPRRTANELFTFLRAELPFYRVQYNIKRGGVESRINTPRFTTVFGVDETARFIPRSEMESSTATHPTTTPTSISTQEEGPTPTANLILTSINPTSNPPKYTHPPRPIPTCLSTLLSSVQSSTKTSYNFILVNYYASGEDSISFHSDDERFLGPDPSIASLSLGGEREFVMKHKPFPPPSPSPTPTSQSNGNGVGSTTSEPKTVPIKIPLASGDMVVMRGATQSNWLHSIPKRKGKCAANIKGRINITFRRAMVPGGTNNYYTYNVGSGGVYRWDGERGEMVLQE